MIHFNFTLKGVRRLMSVIHYFIPALRLVVKVTPTPVDDIAVEIVNAAVAPQKDEAGHDPGDEQPGK